MDLLQGSLILGSIAVLLSCVSLFFTWKSGKTTRLTLDSLGEKLNQGLIEVGTVLDPIIKTNSKAMSYFNSMSQDTRLDSTLDRKIGQDLTNQYGDIMEGIKMMFPNVAEYIEDRPEAITKLLPRLNTLISDPDMRKRLNFNDVGKDKKSSFFDLNNK